MDWDRMKAKDLLALFNSFLPKGGAVLSVKVYPSEFGKERVKSEETQGPLELRALPDDSDNDTEEEKVYREKMRDYQFKRLKYYYAVVECDSVDTAAKIYEECDGYEYESSCSVLDLRFIPDDVQFDEEPKDVATDVNLSAYTPKVFTSSATTTSKVQLTWDETDHDRVTAMNRKFNKEELLDMDFNAYLASSSDEESEEEREEGGFKKPQKEDEKKKKKKKKKSGEEQISKYRELLKGIQDKEKKLQEDKDMEMEITWVPGLRETTEQLVKKKMEGKDNLTPWEEFLEKKKDKKKQKKKSDDELSEDELPPDVDLSDPFFAEELAASGNQYFQLIKREEEERTAEEEEELEKQKAEMALLMEDEGDEAKHKHFNYDKIVEQQNLSQKKKKLLKKKGRSGCEGPSFPGHVHLPPLQPGPSHPSYKKTNATQSILTEKQRRRDEEKQVAGKKREKDRDAAAAVDLTSKKAMDPSLSMLVKSIKSKTEQFQARKKQKLV
uniref:ESF1, nucleolar pre-rRNA processing protein, homolog (S. cerevisiae) n=1 Tax=Labrus bergylta TaxID=56723 RepID=A0A3Q3GE65_9LABR